MKFGLVKTTFLSFDGLLVKRSGRNTKRKDIYAEITLQKRAKYFQTAPTTSHDPNQAMEKPFYVLGRIVEMKAANKVTLSQL